MRPMISHFCQQRQYLLTYILDSFLTVLIAYGVVLVTQLLGCSAQTGAWIGLLCRSKQDQLEME